jgi:serine/threonine protein kinase/tetratricopeptide (TPR) repeat protein
MIDLTKVESLFFAALEKSSAQERAAFLDEACGNDAELRQHVERMVAAHPKAAHFLDAPAPAPVATIDELPIRERPGTVIGPYKLLQQIGEGGMGVVYMAEQETPVRRKVALKIIKPGMDSRQVVARFEAERQALAMMDHQNIARVLDVGTTGSGRPYFVMELVHGVPITQFCDDSQLTPRERLELFVPVCQAIQHAHQKGIIHRDIKPTNVLVTMYDDKPVPKVIDFGVAKAVEQRLTEKTLFTQFGTLVGTFEYMSPEQAEMNAFGVDTRSDLYSLGVLLYELLTGTTPLGRKRLREAALDELVRLIKQEEPPRPSVRLSSSGNLAKIAAARKTEPARLSKLVKGEIDWIVMKCLEKDRTRRYETANGLARDVERYLHDEPVEACPPSASYRLRKYARKHRAAFATAAGFAALLLLGTAVSTWQAIRATTAETVARAESDAKEQARQEEEQQRKAAVAEKERADEEAEVAKAVSDFLANDLLRKADWRAQNERREAADPDVKVRVLLDRAAKDVEGKFPSRPRIEAAIRRAIGQAYEGLGLKDQALPQLKRATELFRRERGPDDPETWDTEKLLGSLLPAAEQVALGEQRRDRLAAAFGPNDPLTIRSEFELTWAYERAKGWEQAVAYLEKLRDRLAASRGPNDQWVIRAEFLKLYVVDLRSHDLKVKLLERFRDERVPMLPPDLSFGREIYLNFPLVVRSVQGPSMITQALSKLADEYRFARRNQDAVRTWEQLREHAIRVHAFDRVLMAQYENHLGQAYAQVGRIEEAIAALERSVTIQKELGAADQFTLETMIALARVYLSAGRKDEAMAYVRQMRDGSNNQTIPGGLSGARGFLAHSLSDAGLTAEAITEYEAARATRVQWYPNTSTTPIEHNLAGLYWKVGRTAESIALRESITRYEQQRGLFLPGRINENVPIYLSGWLITLVWDNQSQRAGEILQEFVAAARKEAGADEPKLVMFLMVLGSYMQNIGMDAFTEPLLRECLEIRTRRLPDDVLETLTRANQRQRGLDHSQTTFFLASWLKALEQDNQSQRAGEVLREYLAAVRKEAGADETRLAGFQAILGKSFLFIGMAAAAEPLLRECLAIREKKIPDYWHTFNARSLLGEALAGQQKYADAEPLLVQGYEGLKQREAKIDASGKVNLRLAVERLVQLYDAWGKPDEAAKWRKKLEESKAVARPAVQR